MEVAQKLGEAGNSGGKCIDSFSFHSEESAREHRTAGSSEK